MAWRRARGAVFCCLAVLAGCRDGGAPDASSLPATRFAWPLAGAPGRDWVVNNYVDVQPGGGARDYRGGRKTYDRHQGTDLDVPNFRWMDRGFPVLAAAAGSVTAVHDGEFDRNVACGFLDALAAPNLVEVTHRDGSRARYVHLRQGSVQVSVGQRVAAGATLGQVGSSGCSTAPHLHFEVRSITGEVLDPFLLSRWLDPPPYDVPLTLMDYVVKDGEITGEPELKDPPPNASRVAPGATLGIGLVVAGGSPGDRIEVRLEGAAAPDLLTVLGDEPPHRFRFWNVPPTDHQGIRNIAIHGNGALLARHPLVSGGPEPPADPGPEPRDAAHGQFEQVGDQGHQREERPQGARADHPVSTGR